jgi:uncharacterized protein
MAFSLRRVAKAARKPQRIGAHALRLALMAGARAVIAGRDHLNLINVFPVPDGDTGTNMAFTFAAIYDGVKTHRTTDVATLLRAAALAAIDGARGNSGAITAQFFYGLSEALKDCQRVSFPELARALDLATKSARRALSEPKEGTILSAMSALSQAAAGGKAQANLDSWLEAATRAVAAAVKRTPSQLAILAEHHVVDAGAQGFLEFIEGIAQLRQQGRALLAQPFLQAELYATGSTHEYAHAHDAPCDSPYRYCSECALVGAAPEHIRAELAGIEHDSLVIAGGIDRAHLHVHTNDPAALFAKLSEFAYVSQRKADDMHAQIRAAHNPATVGIVCDSAADLPEALIRELYIHTVPVRVNFGSDEYIDRITLNTQQFYQRLKSDTTPVRTSQPPGGEFRRLFDQLASHYQHTICITLSEKLSGTYQVALSASRHGGADRTQVWDSHNAATGEALLVMDSARAAQRGLTIDQIKARFERMRPRSITYALIRDASYGVRGGRMPKWMGKITQWFGLNIIVSSRGGKIVPCGVMVGTSDVAVRFANWALARTPRDAKLNIIIGHCDAPKGAQELQAHLQAQQSHAIAELHCVEAGVGIGAHAGPSTLVLGIQRSLPWPDSDPEVLSP